MSADVKVAERRVRRAAGRKVLFLQKSRVLDVDHPDYGMWWATELPSSGRDYYRLGRLVSPRDGLTLDGIVAFVASYQPQRVPVDVSGLPERGNGR